MAVKAHDCKRSSSWPPNKYSWSTEKKETGNAATISLFFFLFFLSTHFPSTFFSGGWLCKLLIAHGRVGWLTTFLLASLLTVRPTGAEKNL